MGVQCEWIVGMAGTLIRPLMTSAEVELFRDEMAELQRKQWPNRNFVTQEIVGDCAVADALWDQSGDGM